MMKKRILPIISCLLLLLVPIFCLLALSIHCYNTFENLFIDKIYTIFDSTPLSRFTTFVNIIGAVFSLFLVPYFIMKVIDPDYSFPKSISFVIKIVRRNYVLVFIFVIFIMFPISFVGNTTLQESLDSLILNENLYTHIICPIIFFVATHFYSEEKTTLKESLYMFIPSIVYAFIYAIMVYVVKTWEDFYFTKNIYDILGFFTFPIVLVLLIGVNFLVSYIDNSITSKINSIRCHHLENDKSSSKAN